MVSERRRDPPPPKAVCLRCGWNGTPAYQVLRDAHGDAALTVSAKRCPNCSATLFQRELKPPLPIQIMTAIREADLGPDELLELAEAVREAAPDSSPREVASRAPAAAKLINIASRAGENWLQLLTVVLMVVFFYVQHQDAQQAHRDAQQAIDQAHADAIQALRQEQGDARDSSTTGGLTEEDIAKIAHQVEQDFKSAAAR